LACSYISEDYPYVPPYNQIHIHDSQAFCE
jgi:hypothetical protein